MRKITIYCDKCGKEITGTPIRIDVYGVDREDGETVVENDETVNELSEVTAETDFCPDCIMEVLRNLLTTSEPEEKSEPAPVPEKPKKEKKPKKSKMNPTGGRPRHDVEKPGKRYYITGPDADTIRQRYRAGDDMIDIADELNLGRALVSRFVDSEGLGKERYHHTAETTEMGVLVHPEANGEEVVGDGLCSAAEEIAG